MTSAFPTNGPLDPDKDRSAVNDDLASGRHELLKTEIQARASEEDEQNDSTSRRHPFLGMAASADTVKFVHKSPTRFLIAHTLRMNRSLWIWFFLFAVYPFSILLYDRFGRTPMGIIDSDFNWYALLVVGLSGLSVFGYLLLSPRWIECDFHEQTIIYRIGGLRKFRFKINMQDMMDVDIRTHFVV